MTYGVQNRGVSFFRCVLIGAAIGLSFPYAHAGDPVISGGPGPGPDADSCCLTSQDYLSQAAKQEAKNQIRSKLEVGEQTFAIPLGSFPKVKSKEDLKEKRFWILGTLGIKGGSQLGGTLFDGPTPTPSPSPGSSPMPSPSPSPSPAAGQAAKNKIIDRDSVNYKVSYGVTLWATVGSKEKTFANPAILDFKSGADFLGAKKSGAEAEKQSISKRILLFGVTVDVWANLLKAATVGASLASADGDELSALAEKKSKELAKKARQKALLEAQKGLDPYLPPSVTLDGGGQTVSDLGGQSRSSCANDWNGPWQFRVDLYDICRLGTGTSAGCQQANKAIVYTPPDIFVEFRVGFFASLALSVDLKIGAPGINSTMTLNNDITALKNGSACAVDGKETAKRLWGQFKSGLAPVFQSAVNSAEMVAGASIRLAKAMRAYREVCKKAQEYYEGTGKEFDCAKGLVSGNAGDGVESLSCEQQNEIIASATAEEREYLEDVSEARSTRNQAWLGLGMETASAAMNFFEFDSKTFRIKQKDSVKEELDELADQYRDNAYFRIGFGVRLDARVSVWLGVGVGVGLGPLNVTAGVIGNMNLVDIRAGTAVTWDTNEKTYLNVDGKYEWRLLTGNIEVYAKGEAGGQSIEFRETLMSFDENGVTYGSFLSSLNQSPPPERKVLFDNQIAIGDLVVPATKWVAVPNENWRFVKRDSKLFRIDLRELWKDVFGNQVPGSGRSAFINCWNMNRTPTTVDPRCFSDTMDAGERALTEAYAKVQQGYVAAGPQNTLEEKNCAIEVGTDFLTSVLAQNKEDCLSLAGALSARMLLGEAGATAEDPRIQLVYSEYLNSCANNPAGCFVTHSTSDPTKYQIPIQVTYEMTAREQLSLHSSQVPDFYGQRNTYVELKMPGVQSLSFVFQNAPSVGATIVPDWAKHNLYPNRRPSMSLIARRVYAPKIQGDPQLSEEVQSAFLLPQPAQFLSLSVSLNPDSGNYQTSQIVVKPGLGLTPSAYGMNGSSYQTPNDLPKVNDLGNSIRKIRPEAPKESFYEFPEDLMINIGDLDPLPYGFFPGSQPFGNSNPSTLDGYYVELSSLPLLSDAELFQLAYSSKLGSCRIEHRPEKAISLVRDDQLFVGDDSNYYKSTGLEIVVNGLPYPERGDPEGRVIYNLLQGRGGVTPTESIFGSLVKLSSGDEGARYGRYYTAVNLDLSDLPKKEARYAAAQLRAALLAGECFQPANLRLLTQMTSISKAEFWTYFDTDKIKNAAMDMDSPEAVEDKRVIGDFFGQDNKYCVNNFEENSTYLKYGKWANQSGEGCKWKWNYNDSVQETPFGQTLWGPQTMRTAFGCSIGIVGKEGINPQDKYSPILFSASNRKSFESNQSRGRLWFVYSGTSLSEGGSYHSQMAQTYFGGSLNYVVGDSAQVNPLVYFFDGDDFKCEGFSNQLNGYLGLNGLSGSRLDDVYEFLNGTTWNHWWEQAYGIDVLLFAKYHYWAGGGWNPNLMPPISLIPGWGTSEENNQAFPGWLNIPGFRRLAQLQKTKETASQNDTLKNNLGAQLRACLSQGPCELLSGEVTLLTGSPTDPSGSLSAWDRVVDFLSGKDNRSDLADGIQNQKCTLALGGSAHVLLDETISGKPTTRDATSVSDCQIKFSDLLAPEFCGLPEVVQKAYSQVGKAIPLGEMKYFNVDLVMTPKMGLSEFMEGSGTSKSVGRCVYEDTGNSFRKPYAPLLSLSEPQAFNPSELVTCRLSFASPQVLIREHRVKPELNETPAATCVRVLGLIPPSASNGPYEFDQGLMIPNVVMKKYFGNQCETKRVSKNTENLSLQFSYTAPGSSTPEAILPVSAPLDWSERASLNPLDCQDQPQCQLVVKPNDSHPASAILPDGQKFDFSPTQAELALGGSASEICARAAKSSFGASDSTISCSRVANLPFFAPFRKPLGSTSAYPTTVRVDSKWAHEEQFGAGVSVTCDQSATGSDVGIAVRGTFTSPAGALSVPFIKAYDSDPFQLNSSGTRQIDEKISVSVLDPASGQTSTVQVTAAFVEALAWIPPELKVKKQVEEPDPLGALNIGYKYCANSGNFNAGLGNRVVPYNYKCPNQGGLENTVSLVSFQTEAALLQASVPYVMNYYVYIPKNRCARTEKQKAHARSANLPPLRSLDGPIEWELTIRGLEGMTYLKQVQTQTCARELAMQGLTGDASVGDRAILAVRGDFKSAELYPDPFIFKFGSGASITNEQKAMYFRDGVFNPKFSSIQQGAASTLEERLGASQIEQTCQLARETLYQQDGYKGPVSLYMANVGTDGKIQLPLSPLQDQLTERARVVCQGAQYGRCQMKLTTTSGLEEIVDFSKSNIFTQSGGRATGMDDCEAEIKDLDVCASRDKLSSIPDQEGFSFSAIFKPGFSGDENVMEKALGECAPRAEPRVCEIGFKSKYPDAISFFADGFSEFYKIDEMGDALNGYLGSSTADFVVPLGFAPRTRASCLAYAENLKSMCLWKPINSDGMFDRKSPYKVVARWGSEEINIENCHAAPMLAADSNSPPDGEPILGAGASNFEDLGFNVGLGTITINAQYPGDSIGLGWYLGNYQGISLEIERSVGNDCQGPFAPLVSGAADSVGAIQYPILEQDEGKFFCFRSRVHGPLGFSEWSYLPVEVPGGCAILARNGLRTDGPISTIQRLRVRNSAQCSQVVQAVDCSELQSAAEIPTTRDTPLLPVFAGREDPSTQKVCELQATSQGQGCFGFFVNGTDSVRIPGLELPFETLPSYSSEASLILPPFDTWKNCVEELGSSARKAEVCSFVRKTNTVMGQDQITVLAGMNLSSGFKTAPVLNCLGEPRITHEFNTCTATVRWNAGEANVVTDAVLTSSSGVSFPLGNIGAMGTHPVAEWIQAAGRDPSEFLGNLFTLQITSSVPEDQAQFGPKFYTFPFLNPNEACAGGEILQGPISSIAHDGCDYFITWKGMSNPESKVEIKALDENGKELNAIFQAADQDGFEYRYSLKELVSSGSAHFSVMIRAHAGEKHSQWKTFGNQVVSSCIDGLSPLVSPVFVYGCNVIKFEGLPLPGVIEVEGTDSRGNVFVKSITNPTSPLDVAGLFAAENPIGGIVSVRIRQVQGLILSDWSDPQENTPCDGQSGAASKGSGAIGDKFKPLPVESAVEEMVE